MTLTAARPSRVAAPAALRKKRRRHRLVVLGFLSPWIVGFLIFFGYPFVATVYYSFTRYDLFSPPEFVGLLNYEFMIFDDPDVRTAALNTLWLVLFMVPAKVVFALALAQILTRLRRGVGFWRSVFYLPALAPPVAATIAFVFLFNPEFGVVNGALEGLGIEGPGWFTDPDWSKPSLTILALWGAGDVMIIMLAALLDVPTDLYDAADVDGAGSAQKFRFVTLPTISPVLGFAAITGVIQTLQYFTQAAVAARRGVRSGVHRQGRIGRARVPGTVHIDLSAMAVRPWLWPELSWLRGGAGDGTARSRVRADSGDALAGAGADGRE